MNLFFFLEVAKAAAATTPEPTIEGIVSKFQNQVLVPIISLLFVLATLVFLWGILQYVVGSGGDDNKIKKGKEVMKWGIIGMVIMASAWGIVGVICNYFGTCSSVAPSGFQQQSGSSQRQTILVPDSPSGSSGGSLFPSGSNSDIFSGTTAGPTSPPPPRDPYQPPPGKGAWLFITK